MPARQDTSEGVHRSLAVCKHKARGRGAAKELTEHERLFLSKLCREKTKVKKRNETHTARNAPVPNNKTHNTTQREKKAVFICTHALSSHAIYSTAAMPRDARDLPPAPFLYTDALRSRQLRNTCFPPHSPHLPPSTPRLCFHAFSWSGKKKNIRFAVTAQRAHRPCVVCVG